jgi:hypothetical protein
MRGVFDDLGHLGDRGQRIPIQVGMLTDDQLAVLDREPVGDVTEREPADLFDDTRARRAATLGNGLGDCLSDVRLAAQAVACDAGCLD